MGYLGASRGGDRRSEPTGVRVVPAVGPWLSGRRSRFRSTAGWSSPGCLRSELVGAGQDRDPPCARGCTRSAGEVHSFGRSGVARRRRSTGEARAGVARRRAAEAPARRWAACGPPGRAGAGSGPGGASLPVYSPMASTSRRRRVGSSRARTARNRSGWAWFGGDGDLWLSSFPTFTGSVSHCRQRTGTAMGLIGPTRGAAHHRRTRHPPAGARIEPVQTHERQVGLAARSGGRQQSPGTDRSVRAG